MDEGKYYQNYTEFDSYNDDEVIWSISGYMKEEDNVYTYNEAINLTGNGWYNISLLMVLSLAVQAMALDMFGFSYVVAAAACDLELTHNQTSLLLSVPLMGSIFAAYLHGYASDTRGRRKCLSFVLWGSFIINSLSALSPNFTVLAVLKFLGSSLSSGVASTAATLLGESCSVHVKDRYTTIVVCSLMSSFAMFTAHAYVVLGLNFTYDLGFIVFKPWRMLILTLALTLGSSAVLVELCYESPQFLINAGRIDEALDILRKIKKRNMGNGVYPVKKILQTTNAIQRNEVSLLRSFWDQTAPLFTPPLLQRTLILFYLTMIMYSINNSFFVWTPVILGTFFKEHPELSNHTSDNFCELILSSRHLHSSEKSYDCTSVVNLETLLMAITQGLIFSTINFGVARLVHKKKTVMIFFFVLPSVCCIALLYIREKITIIIFFFAVRFICMGIGMALCYINELYPTRYSGMMSSLNMMVARISSLVGVNLIGTYMFSICTTSLYSWGAFAFSGALMALLLPPDVPKHT